MKFACTVDTSAPADAHPLATRRVDQPSGGVVRRVLEDAAGASSPRLVSRVASAGTSAIVSTDSFGVAAVELQLAARHDVVGAERRVPVAVPEVVDARRSRAITRRQVDDRRADEHVGHASFVRTGVHAHRPAERRRDLRCELEPGEAESRGQLAPQPADTPHRRARASITGALVVAERAPEPYGDAAEAVVGHEEVRPTSDDRDVGTFASDAARTSATARRSSSDSASTRTSAGPPTRNVVNGASDACTSTVPPTRARSAPATSSRSTRHSVGRRARRAARGCAAPAVVTSPAPSVRTTSPDCGSRRRTRRPLRAAARTRPGHPGAAVAHRIGHDAAADPGDRLLARAVDVGDEDDVGSNRTNRANDVAEVQRPRVEVRLEEGDDPAVRDTSLAPRASARCDLLRVVRVVVDHEDAVDLAADA